MFGRRHEKPLLVTTEVTTRVKRMTPPTGPAIPLAEHQPSPASQQEDAPRAIRQSALVIGFLASGAPAALLTEGVHRALTEAEGCGLPGADSREAFAEEWCSTPERRRRLVTALVLHQPAANPTGTRTRLAVATWLRNSSFASVPEAIVAA
jgi:hypothetical protein